MDTPLQARTANEARYYLLVTPCDACGRGPYVPQDDRQDMPPGRAARLPARCKSCGREREFTFVCERAGDGECINPADAPSRIVDVAQWLSLYYMLAESADDQDDPTRARLGSRRAALCLAEALKFYEAGEELPPASAFFSDTTAASFRLRPENFARQKLQELRARLPVAGEALDPAGSTEKRRPWWRFWRR